MDGFGVCGDCVSCGFGSITVIIDPIIVKINFVVVIYVVAPIILIIDIFGPLTVVIIDNILGG